MDSKRVIKSYLKPSAAKTIITWVLFALMILSFVMGVSAGGKDDTAEAAPFHPLDTKAGSYSYIDVTEISTWLYKYDSNVYYTAADAEGYFYIVQLNQSQYDEMEPQQEYWKRSSDDAVMPAPYRLYGTAQTASNETKESVASSWGITESEYGDYFGTLYLNATTSPSGESSALWLLLAAFVFLFWIALFATGIKASSNIKRSIAALEAAGELDAAAEALAAPGNTVLGKDAVRLSDKYIFSRSGAAVVRYADIIMAYKRVSRYYFITVGEALLVHTATMKNLSLAAFSRKTAGDFDTIMDRIYEKNPEVLFGYTSENIKAYREKAKTAKSSQ